MNPAVENPLLGTWELSSYVVTTDAGVRSTPYGDHPIGYLSYSPDGRMQVVGTASGRFAPREAALTDREQAALQETMFAYAGAYSLEPGKVIHHVAVSWNEVWNGTDQVRSYEIHGDTLTLTSRLIDPASGAEARYVVVWKKMTNLR
jgi:hypothetical protein